ncbi:unnamed protein product [Brassica oleracea]
MCKCRSHGTFPLFGLQSSHLNICYYHQDLHRRPLRPGSRPRFCSDRRALLLIEAWLLPRRPGIGRALQRHPFSGLVDSAAHVPYWWVNNPTLGEFCFTMIGRADIEGSKSNVAMNAWLPQASYPCGNFSDTSSFKFRRSKGSIGHAFTMCRPSQTPHLTMSSARIDPPKRVLGLKEGVVTPPPIHGVSKITRIPLVRTSSELAVRRPGKAPERAVPSPSPGRHEAVRSRHVSGSSSPPTVDGFGTGTPEPSPQSQSFSRSYGSILPTSLAYIVPSTRGCSPWRPDAVMSTTGRERHSVLRIFKGRRECTGHHATCGALPAAGPYLRLSRFQDVPPQPNSPPDNVLRPDRPAEASLGSKRRGCYPASDSRIGLESSSTGSSFPADSAKPVPLAVVSLDSRQGHRIPLVRTSSELAVRRPGKAPERAVPSPSPGRHEAVRSRHVSGSSSPPTVDGGCSPWRPDAVMSTTGRERHSVLRIFKGRRECTGHHATCGALPAAGPYLRLSRFQGRALQRHPFSGLVDSAVVCKGFYPPLGGNYNSRRSGRRFRRTDLANDTCLWEPKLLLRVGNRAAGACVASSPDSDLEAFSHNPAHAHVPYWWVNNPTLGEFCFTMIGRADIEGSKSNVAMNAWLPQASYPFGLESSSTGSSFPADSAKPVPLAVVSLDSRQGHRIPLVRTSSELAVRRPGKAPERAVPSPSPGRHEAVRSRHVSGSSSPPTVDGGCSPWRPDAVMSTTGRERHSVLRIFKGRRECTGHHATCGALPAAGPYLRLSRFQDERFARQYRCGPPPEFPLASPRSGIVHHLSGPDRHAHTRTLLRKSRSVGCAPARDPANQLPYALRVYSPVDSHTCQTPWSVFQDGSNGEPTGRRPEHADAEARREARAADHD